MTVHVRHMTVFVVTMTLFVLNMTVLFRNMNVFVLNITGFVLIMTGFVHKFNRLVELSDSMGWPFWQVYPLPVFHFPWFNLQEPFVEYTFRLQNILCNKAVDPRLSILNCLSRFCRLWAERLARVSCWPKEWWSAFRGSTSPEQNFWTRKKFATPCGSTCPLSVNKEEWHQGSTSAGFYSWKVIMSANCRTVA